MVWAICIGIWLMIVAAVIAFLYGAFGTDTEKEREQDWEDFKKYMERRNKDVNKGILIGSYKRS